MDLKTKYFRGIGLMSGTSLDGIDLAYCEFAVDNSRWNFELLAAETIPYDEQWYARLACIGEQNAETYARTHVYLGHLFGKAVAQWIERNELKPQFVASHGQTIFHQPQRNFTSQIGDGETISSYLSCPVVSNFRNKNVALSGQGAPLVPFGERHLFPDVRLFLNLGGIANISYGELAWDISPCNMVLNWLARQLDPPQHYDADGATAKSGEMIDELFFALESLPYYAQKPPKSLGAEWFEAAVMPLLQDPSWSLADRLHTVTLHVVTRIVDACKSMDIRNTEMLITGGGAHNAFLVGELEQALRHYGIRLQSAPEAVIDFKEAIIFAFLGLNTLLGRPNTLASVTGSDFDVIGGSIHLPPKGWERPIL